MKSNKRRIHAINLALYQRTVSYEPQSSQRKHPSASNFCYLYLNLDMIAIKSLVIIFIALAALLLRFLITTAFNSTALCSRVACTQNSWRNQRLLSNKAYC